MNARRFRNIFVGLIIVAAFFPLAAKTEMLPAGNQSATFRAKVIEIVREEKKVDEKGKEMTRQTVRLRGLDGEWKDREIVYDGIALGVDFVELIPSKAGDNVWMRRDVDAENNEIFFITDYVRTGKLYFLAILFAFLVVLTGRWHGFKALVGLAITFVVLMKFIIPGIVAGYNPLGISILGSLVILAITLYLVHGVKSKTNVALVATLITLLITGILSMAFTYLTRLTGFADEEASYLVTMGQNILNIKGILLAGMVIGALGVLDDITVSQASVVEEIYRANPGLGRLEVYKRAMRVGIDHVSSIVNTLVLAYAGASLPLLLLFDINRATAGSVGSVINNEAIATEIVRTLVGSIGLVVAVPLTSLIAVYWLKNRVTKASNEDVNHFHCH